MTKLLICLLLAAWALFPGTAAAEEYRNPMTIPDQYPPIRGASDDYGIGDPFVMRFNGMYYLYASSCEDRVRVFTSRDLINWEFRGWCTENKDVYFAYAPEVTYWRGDFYMITSPNGGGHYILKSESPLGPFRPVTHNFGYQIDGSFFTDDDGRLMIIFPEGNQIKQCYLNEKSMLPDGLKYSTGATLRHWTEGPGLFRRGDWYYLTFTGNHLLSSGYRVAYAVRQWTPAGKFEQPADGTLLIHSVFGDKFTGLGHSSNVTGPDLDSLYTAYHSYVSIGGPARLYNLDRLYTNGGYLYTSGPTNFPMPAPAMPDVYGDAAGDPGDFAETEDGWFACVPDTPVFTQECSFMLAQGGTAAWLAGSTDGKPVTIETDGARIRLLAGDEERYQSSVPALGEAGRLHTLRVECTEEVLYVSIDGMRLLSADNPGITASRTGAVKRGDTRYSFMACTAQALGSGDNTALKVLPGGFSAVHALNGKTLEREKTGSMEEQAAVLGSADYAVRIAGDGTYVFDLTVRTQDAGKEYGILLDGGSLLEGTVPEYTGPEDYFTFSSAAAVLPAGDHTLTVRADSLRLSRIAAFRRTDAAEMHNDFSSREMRDAFITLGAFVMNAEEKSLYIRSNRTGFALFGDEGYTDYGLHIRFRIPQEGSGTSGVMLRATNVSLYDAQVAESYYGYGIVLSRLGFSVQRTAYGPVGSAQFRAVPAWKEAEEGELVIRVQGNRLEIGLPDETPLYTAEDPHPFTHGLYGFFSTGKELRVLGCDLIPPDRGEEK